MHMRAVLHVTASTAPSTGLASTSSDPDPVGQGRPIVQLIQIMRSRATATPATPATNDEPASPVLLCRSDRQTQPHERYSPGLFLTDYDEPTSYKEATKSEDFSD